MTAMSEEDRLEEELANLRERYTELKSIAIKVNEQVKEATASVVKANLERDAAYASNPDFSAIAWLDGIRADLKGWNPYDRSKTEEHKSQMRIKSARLSRFSRIIKWAHQGKGLLEILKEEQEIAARNDAKRAAKLAREAAKAAGIKLPRRKKGSTIATPLILATAKVH